MNDERTPDIFAMTVALMAIGAACKKAHITLEAALRNPKTARELATNLRKAMDLAFERDEYIGRLRAMLKQNDREYSNTEIDAKIQAWVNLYERAADFMEACSEMDYLYGSGSGGK
jgi:hypothetical protein